MDVPVRLAGRSDCATASAPPCTLVVFGAGGDLTKRLFRGDALGQGTALLVVEGAEGVSQPDSSSGARLCCAARGCQSCRWTVGRRASHCGPNVAMLTFSGR